MKKLVWVAAVSFALLTATGAHAETYRLLHAIGNAEQVAARGLTKDECEARKKELKAVATQVGTYSEALGVGSITCLAESLFED